MAQAGPSNPKSKLKKSKQNVVKSSKVKKVSESKTIAALEDAVMQFVSVDDAILPYSTYELIVVITQEAPPNFKAFTDLPISMNTKRGEIFLCICAVDFS